MRKSDWWKWAASLVGWLPGWKGALLLTLLFVCYLFVMALLVAG